MTQVFLSTTPGTNFTYTSDATWNNASNTVEVIGAGGSGAACKRNNALGGDASGGGGGEYGKTTNFSFATPGTTTAVCRVGLGGAATTGGISSSAETLNGTAGGDTWFNGTTQAGSTLGGIGGAFGGFGASAGGAGGTGGVGTTHNAGGRGGHATVSGRIATGGGGAGGTTAVGSNGVDSATFIAATNGGAGGATNGGTAGTGNAVGTPGGNGGAGTSFDATHGAGGGGGGCSTGLNSAATGGSGGNYGAGGGGCYNAGSGGAASTQAISGAGANGIIVLTWTPAGGAVTPTGWGMTGGSAPLKEAFLAASLAMGSLWVPQPITPPVVAAPSLAWQWPLSNAPSPVSSIQSRPIWQPGPPSLPGQGGFQCGAFQENAFQMVCDHLLWYQPLSRAPQVIVTPVQAVQLLQPLGPPTPAITPVVAGWYQSLGIAPKQLTPPLAEQPIFVSAPVQIPSGWTGQLYKAPTPEGPPTSWSYVPFDTAQIVAYTPTLDWQQPFLAAPRLPLLEPQQPSFVSPPATIPSGWTAQLYKAPAGLEAPPSWSFVPFDTIQFQPTPPPGWVQQLYRAPPPPGPPPSWSFVPFDTQQVALNYTNYGWFAALAKAPSPLGPAPSWAYVPYNTVQQAPGYVPSAWYSPLAKAPAPPGPPPSYSYVPFDTVQTVVVTPNLAWQQPFTAAIRQPAVIAGQPSFIVPPFQLPSGWTAQLYKAPAPLAPAVSWSFVPLDTPQLSVGYTNFGWYQPLAIAPRPLAAPIALQPIFVFVPSQPTPWGWYGQLSQAPRAALTAPSGWSYVPLDTAQITVVFVPNLSWQQPLSSAPKPVVVVGLGSYSFVPFNTTQVTPPPVISAVPHNLHYHVTVGKLRSF